MPTLRVDPRSPAPEAMARAARILRRGGLVAFPTETVYGLGANTLNEDAVRRIYEVKGRPSVNPLIVHVPDVERARGLSAAWPEVADRLANAFWPGPLTLVVPRHERVPSLVSAELPTVAIRVPRHPVALALLRAAAVPVVAPSANPSMAVSPTRAEHVERGLGDQVELILDAGPTGVGIESTVVDLTRSPPALLRPGALSGDDLASVIGALETLAQPDDAGPRASPGMLDRHYAPRARLELLDAADHEGAGQRLKRPAGARVIVGALLRDWPDLPGVQHPIRMPTDPSGYARELYTALHRLDALGCGLIVVEGVPPGPAWEGVRDRLRRASS